MGGCESVKLDLICSKGVVYAKFRTASAALRALEDIEAHGSQVRHIAPANLAGSTHLDAV